MVEDNDSGAEVVSSPLFDCFGDFRYRFEAMYLAAGNIRELIENQEPGLHTWKQALQQQIDAMADAIATIKT